MSVQITTTTLPGGVQGVAYSQTVQQFGGQAPLTFTVSAGALPTGITLTAGSGLLAGTPTTPGTYNFTIQVTDTNSATDTQAYTVKVYAPLNTTPDPVVGQTAVVVESGSQTQFSATGGSGEYYWSVDGGNLINPYTGLLTAVNGGSYTVTLTDTESGQIATIAIVVTSQSQFCAIGAVADAPIQVSGRACCEFNVECGEQLQLKVPSFHIVEDGNKKAIVYGNVVQATTGKAALLQATSAPGGASANTVSFNRDAYFEIVTNADMADVNNGEFAIGFSSVDADQTVSSIEHAVVWFSDTGARKVEIRHSGSAEASTKFDIAAGDAVTFGVIDGALQLWINSVAMAVSTNDFSTCGNPVLDISIPAAGLKVGGYVGITSWSVLTAGSASEVGSIDADGVYSSPVNPIAGVIEVAGVLGTANFFVNIRNIQPTPKYIKPQPFLAGRRAHVWVTNQKATDAEIIRIASDGSPDALQNPGMIYLGVLEGSAKFAEEIEYQNFDNDEGTYFTAVSSEKASLTGTFLEVRDLDKLALMMQHATLHPTEKGVRELSVGGKTCGSCDLRAVLIVESGTCGTGWDVIYLPRVQNTANLNLEIGKKTNSKYELNFKVLPDLSRAEGRQLYSIYQIEKCGDPDSGLTCS